MGERFLVADGWVHADIEHAMYLMTIHQGREEFVNALVKAYAELITMEMAGFL